MLQYSVSSLYRVKYILMYSIQYIVIYTIKCRKKCVVHWRGGREGSFPEGTGQPLLAPFKACTMYSTVYCTVQQMMDSIIYSIVYSLLYSRVVSSKSTIGKKKVVS